MRIENIRTEKAANNRKRAVATIIWEDCDRPKMELFFETDPEFEEGLSGNPHAFLVGCIMAAMNHGEKRIFCEAEVCPELIDGLVTVMKRFAYWYDWYQIDAPIVRIEVKKRFNKSLPPTDGRQAMFFSGGIDSLATLRNNRINFPLGHPSSIDDGFLVYGLEVEEPKIFDYVMNTVPTIAKDADLTLIPVYTNLRYLDDSWEFWEHEFMGSLFSAIAHAFSRRVNSVLIASHYDIPFLKNPYGSHPLIDLHYSSSDLRVRHDRPLSRFEKTKMISDWDCAIQNVRVCNKTTLYESEQLNCSECEKCLRTMMELLACGVLHKATAFKYDNVTPEMISLTIQLNQTICSFYPEMVGPLQDVGRYDLTNIIEKKLIAYNKLLVKQRPLATKLLKIISIIDRNLLFDSLRKIRNYLVKDSNR
jgi:hypothetical protein